MKLINEYIEICNALNKIISNNKTANETANGYIVKNLDEFKRKIITS